MDLLNDEVLQKMMIAQKQKMKENIYASEKYSREERIARFNKKAAQLKSVNRAMRTTYDFMKKGGGIPIQLSSLCPIPLAELEISKIHRGRVVYCRIASQVMHMSSVMVLVDDESALVDLAVYGTVEETNFKEGRLIAIKEPFYKLRHDDTKGIRVDDPNDIVFDPPIYVSKHHEPNSTSSPVPRKRNTIEERLQAILSVDSTKGVNNLYRQLTDEGYNVDKKRVRALKKAIMFKRSSSPATIDSDNVLSIIAERVPNAHRVLQVSKVSQYKAAGNKAFVSKSYILAEKLYSDALLNKDGPIDNSVSKIHLWQLYSNLSAARVKLGFFTEAFQDSLKANRCAPMGEVKPLLRCAEAMVALGMKEEALKLLSDSETYFSDEGDVFKKKKVSIAASFVLVVGKDLEIKTISDAIRVAPVGAEILVTPGVYQESLYIDKPLTLRCADVRDYAAIESLENGGSCNWAEIKAVGQHAVMIHCNQKNIPGKAIHIVGFKIECSAPPNDSFHAVRVCGGNVVLRNCEITSSSGPVVCAQFKACNLILQACAIHSGAQGGILAVDGARLSLHHTHSCYNAATGLEIRTGAFAFLQGCHFYRNGRQGIVSWMKAGELIAKNCEIHSQSCESGVLVGEAEATFCDCKLYGNSLSGGVAQDKGSLHMIRCEVHNNCEGILIQSKSSARIEKCDVHSNRANGIFVGFDHVGSAVLIENEVYNNNSKGLMIGNKTNQTIVRGNNEHGNLGNIPLLPTNTLAGGAFLSKKHLKRFRKNEAGISKGMKESTPTSFMDQIVKDRFEHADVMGYLSRNLVMCACCKASPSKTNGFSKCSRCGETSYCSRECQKVHWREHKRVCQDKNVKYPSFLDKNASV